MEKTLISHLNTCKPSQVPLERQSQSDCFILLTAKDHDRLGSDEYMGDAFLSFQQITRGDSEETINDLEQILLQLSYPCNKGSFIYLCV